MSHLKANHYFQGVTGSWECTAACDSWQCSYVCLTLVHCRAAEKLAAALGTSADLPSRLSSAMMQALAEAAASNGHTYMFWEALQKQSLKLLRDTGMPYAINTRLHSFGRQTLLCHHYHCRCFSCHLLLFDNFAIFCN